MPITAESQVVLNVLAQQGVKALDELPAAEGRAYFNAVFKTKPEDQEACARIEELTIPVASGDIPARLYAPPATGKLPVLVHYHGGGWVYMNLDTHDAYCRLLANRTGCAVIAVEYRKAPEYPFPIPLEDCYAALRWTVSNADKLGLDATRLGVIGDSAGGNLAAAVAIMARDQHGPAIKAQVLTYPAVDATMSQPSVTENAAAPLLGRPQMDWFWKHYNKHGGNAQDPRLSPLYASDLSRLPPAFISTAEFDPLRDEGEAYANKLRAAGVAVDYRRYDGVFHGFMLMAKIIPEGAQLIAAQAAFIKQHLA
nr:lipase/esterase AS-Trib6 [uncultured bacterium]